MMTIKRTTDQPHHTQRAMKKKRIAALAFTIVLGIVFSIIFWFSAKDVPITDAFSPENADAALDDSADTDESIEGDLDDVDATPMALTLYADDIDVFKMAAFQPEGFDLEDYEPLPNAAVKTFNDRLLPTLTSSAFPLAVTGLLGHNRLWMTNTTDLSRAAGGTGFRAITRGAGGKIIQNVTLSSSTPLLAIGLAITTGSAIYHYNRTANDPLNLVQHKLDTILNRMDTELRADIEATAQSVDSSKIAFENGDFNEGRHIQLERFQKDLRKIAIQTRSRVYESLAQQLEDDFAGTGNAYGSALNKYEDIQVQIAIHYYVVHLSLENWYVRALYPEHNSARENELTQFDTFLSHDSIMKSKIESCAQKDLETIHGFWNKNKTLQARKDDIQQRVDQVLGEFDAGYQEAQRQLESLRNLNYQRNGAASYMIDMKDGKAVAMYAKREPATE